MRIFAFISDLVNVSIQSRVGWSVSLTTKLIRSDPATYLRLHLPRPPFRFRRPEHSPSLSPSSRLLLLLPSLSSSSYPSPSLSFSSSPRSQKKSGCTRKFFNQKWLRERIFFKTIFRDISTYFLYFFFFLKFMFVFHFLIESLIEIFAGLAVTVALPLLDVAG